ncbi:reverse transcriptase domain-containing protein [Tanacetum coccineum]
MYGMILYLVQCESLCRIPVFLPLTRGDKLVSRAKLEPEEVSSESKKLQPLGSRVPLMGEEFEASEPSGTDIARITRKEPKTKQKRTRDGKSTKEPGIYQKGQQRSTKCMRMRNFYFPNNSPVTIPRCRNRRRAPNIVEPEIHTIVEVAPMADNRTMEELLQAPTEGYGEAIVIPEINADHFEIKTNLLQLVQANPFHGFERENPHTHINNFKRITSTLKFRDVRNDVIKLMMFPYSLKGAARVWYDKEPPNSILTWEDPVTKFVNQFFPPSKTTHLKNEISRFTQKFEETFSEAWERFKEMLRACPHHRFTELTQIDTFYNGLNENDQDSLNAAAGGNLLRKVLVKWMRELISLRTKILTLVEIVTKKVVTPATCLYCNGYLQSSTTPLSDSRPSLTSFETSDSLLQKFADELALLDPFPSGNEDVNFEADLREIELLLNRDPSIDFLPKITIDPNPERFTDEPAIVCLPPPGDDDDTIPLNEQIPSSFAITSVLPTIEPEDSLIMGDEHLSTFPEKETDEFIKSSVEEMVPIPSESEVTFDNNKGCDLPFCDNKMIFSNPLFGFNDYFTSSDDKSFLKGDVQEENFQVYSNPLFEFDDNYNSSDINPLFNETLEDIENEDSNVSNFDELVLLNTPLFDEDECFDPGGDNDEIDAFLDDYNDSEGDIIEILHNTTHNLSPEVFFDHEPQCFKDEPERDNVKHMVKFFNPRIWEKTFSPLYVRLSSKDRHYLFFTIVIQTLLTYPVNFLFSFGSEDTIFYPGIYAFHFSSLESVAFECPMEVCSSTCFIPWTTKCGDRVKLCDSITKNKALRGRHPMLIYFPFFFFIISNVM